MNLKSILGKVIASIVALYLVLGNFAIAGLGIAEVIAEEVYTPELAVEQNIDKYVQYNKENYKGAEIQTSISVIEKTSKENHLPVNSMKLQIQVPNIDGILPNRVNIIKTNTLLTNGTENYNVNQNYNKDTGLLIVSYENLNNYSEYKENAKDEFEIIYIYPESAYANNNEKKEIKQEVNIEAGYKVYNQLLNSHARKNISVTMSAENLNSLEAVNYEIIGATEVYKGYMYANEQYGNTYKTDYKLTEKLSVLNKDLIDELTVILEQSSYKDSNSKEIKASSTIYKTSKISSTDFYRLLGIDGYMDFYLGNTKYATIKYSDSDDKGNRNYETVYYTVEKENVEAGKVEYPSNTKNVIIKTSKPTGEGIALLKNEKQIISQSKYEKEVKDLKEIKESRNCIVNKIETVNGEQKVTQIENKNNTGIISLKEPTTKISLDLSSNKLSTLTTNNITATIKIDDTNSSCKLVSAGKIEITLPNNLTNVKIRNARSLYENGVYIKTARVENGKIILEVEGKQTTYDNANISGGLNIILDLELDIEDASSSHKENITAKYNDAEVSREIDIVSKYGLLMETVIKNETKNSDEIKVVNTNKNVQISLKDTKQTEKVEINIVNNFDNELSNIQFIGDLKYVDNNAKNTFALNLENEISINKGKVLYSNDRNTWNETYTTQTRYFRIIFDNETLLKGESIKAILKLAVPENLNYNESSYIKYGMSYLINGKTESVYSTIGFVTEESDTQNVIDETKPVLETSVQTLTGDKDLNSGDQVYEGQQIKTIVKLKNNSAKENKYTLNTTIENAVYYETYITGNEYNIIGTPDTRYHEAEIGDVIRNKSITVPAGSTVQYIYYYVVNKDAKNVNNSIKVFDINNNKVFEQNVNNKVKEAKIKLSVEYAYNEELRVTKTLSAIYTVQNYTNKDLNNIEMQLMNSNELVPDSADRFEEINNIDLSYDDTQANMVLVKINQLKANGSIQFGITYNVNLSENVEEQKVSTYATCKYSGNTYVSNKLEKIAYQTKSKLNMEITTNLADGTIREGDNFEIRTHLTNSGLLDLYNTIINLDVNDSITINSAYIIYKDGTKKNIELSEEQTDFKDINLDINKNDDVTIVYNITANQIADEEVDIRAQILDQYENIIEKTLVLKRKSESDIPVTPEDPNLPQTKTYTLSGLAWLDANKDGNRDENESLLPEITVYLVDTETGRIVKDTQGNNITVKTNEKGEYKFDKIAEGSYIVIYEFDINRYKATRYQTPGVDSTLNSDAIINKVTVEGQEKITGATNVLKLTTDLNNIDIGLIENAKFDLSLDKQISKVQVVNSQGTKTKEYENLNFAKVDLVAKYMNNTSVIVTYKFVITNNGDVTGYVENLKDSLPTGLEFSSELNKDWYKAEDGNLYTSSLNGIAIEPGKSTEIELILTKETTENSTGTFKNNAELANISNIEAIEESSTDNNKSSADLLISIKTGSPILYIGITLGSIVLIAIASYIIKKKILDRGI